MLFVFLVLKQEVVIHGQISEVQGENIMTNGMIWKLVRAFKDGCTNVHDKEQSGQTSDSFLKLWDLFCTKVWPNTEIIDSCALLGTKNVDRGVQH